MTKFLERYLNGEYEPVWQELVDAGNRVLEEPMRSDALAVARETMRRARWNVDLIILRLQVIGFQFREPATTMDHSESAAFFIAPAPEVASQIAELEALVGPIPLSLRAWYEQVGSVCLIGAHPALCPYNMQVDVDYPPTATYYADPLEVDPILHAIEECRQQVAEGMSFAAADRPALPIGADFLHKANVSGGMWYHILVPDAAADAVVQEEWHHTTFVNYLRICFRWGGFPGWERYPNPPRAELDFLTQDLIPL